MNVKTIFVEKESYFDSALLMLTSREIKKTSGVRCCSRVATGAPS